MGEAADSDNTTTDPSEPQPVGGAGGDEGTSSGGAAGANPAAGMGGTENGGGASGAGEPNGDDTAGGASGLGGAESEGGESSGGTGGLEDAPAGAGGSGAGGSAGAGNESGGTGGSADSPAGAGGSAPSEGGEYGFSYRNPDADQLDWLCTFQQGDAPGYVYIQLTQTGTMSAGIATVPVYTPDLAQLSIDGNVETLSNPAYDYGGGHHNDSLSFEYDGMTYEYYHSSFGFGFRACQLMDCINVYDPGETTPGTTGCGPDRALPEVCVNIDSDGTHAPLDDTFQKCPGDTG